MNFLTSDLGDLWFLSANDSHKNEEIAQDPRVKLFFQASAHSAFLHLAGAAIITTDQATIEELRSPLLKTWFTGERQIPPAVLPTRGMSPSARCAESIIHLLCDQAEIRLPVWLHRGSPLPAFPLP